MPSPRVSIIIVTYNSAADVGGCLDSIAECLAPEFHETIVVDNGSSDATEAVVRERAWATFVAAGGNLGFAKANNIGAGRARGDHLLLLNPDTLLRAGAVEALIQTVEADQDAWVAGACHVDGQGNLGRCWGDFPSLWWVVANQAPWERLGIKLDSGRVVGRTCEGITETRNVDWVSGACFLMKRGAWERLGGLDEKFFLYFEETDLCSRVWKAGGRVVLVPSAVILHLEGTSVGHLSVTQAVRFMEGLFLFLRNRDGVIVAALSRAWIWAVNAALFLAVARRRGRHSTYAARHRALMEAALTPLPRRPDGSGVGA